MILSVSCNQPSFKNIKFEKGFNAIIAERLGDSTDKDSRNGLGKTTLIEIIHFCLGGTVLNDSVLKSPRLVDWSFTIELTLRGKPFKIQRNTSHPSYINISDSDFSEWPIKPQTQVGSKGRNFLRIKDWNILLGYLVFNIPIDMADSQSYAPTFRSLISYFIRKGVGAFQDPFKHYPQQYEWDKQVNTSYLLGLNWDYASDFQTVKDKENTLYDLRRAADQGYFTSIIGSLGALEAERVRLEQETNLINEQLGTFRVHPQYYAIQDEANQITQANQDRLNKLNINKQILTQYKTTLEKESDLEIDLVKSVYREAGLIMPSNVNEELQRVLEFHNEIVANRKTYLENEISSINDENNQLMAMIENASSNRSRLLGILETHGALQEYSGLQNRVAIKLQRLEEVKSRIDSSKKFQESFSILRTEKEMLFRKALYDFDERKSLRDKTVSIFNQNSEGLYEQPGTLSIDVTEDGFKFKVDIARARSQGINYMKVFCYDLMLCQLRSSLVDSPGFLIHDSTIFDGVDERQVAKALELAYVTSEKNGFQYICLLNSDAIPTNDINEKFAQQFKKSIRATFTDAAEDGGLLGIRF